MTKQKLKANGRAGRIEEEKTSGGGGKQRFPKAPWRRTLRGGVEESYPAKGVLRGKRRLLTEATFFDSPENRSRNDGL